MADMHPMEREFAAGCFDYSAKLIEQNAEKSDDPEQAEQAEIAANANRGAAEAIKDGTL